MDLFTGLIYGFIVALAYGVGEFVGTRKREREIAAKIVDNMLKELQQDIQQLNFGEMLMIPGGWNGETTRGTVVHLIEKTQGPNNTSFYSFITCNGGEGLEYHLSKPDDDIKSGKLKYKSLYF